LEQDARAVYSDSPIESFEIRMYYIYVTQYLCN